LGLFNLNDLLNGFFLFFLEVSLRRIIGVKVVLFDLGCGGKREVFMQSLAHLFGVSLLHAFEEW
jgi:hypothetical protein